MHYLSSIPKHPLHSNVHEVRMNIVTVSCQLFQNWDETELTVNSLSEFKFINVEDQPSLIVLAELLVKCS